MSSTQEKAAKGCDIPQAMQQPPERCAVPDRGPRIPTPEWYEAIKLRDRLRPIQESKGYFFNADEEITLSVLEQLIASKKTHGYMACSCRLANGNYDLDKDIICPCTYRAEDVQEFGSCYCALYVSEAWNRGELSREPIPERRPPEKIIF